MGMLNSNGFKEAGKFLVNSSIEDTYNLVKSEVKGFLRTNTDWLDVSDKNTCAAEQGSLLVFSKTAGFRHRSIEVGVEAVKGLGCDYGLKVDATEDSSTFTIDNLSQYDTVIFLNTTQDILDAQQKSAFKGYIQAGGGFLGIHAATDTEYNWPWYNKLVGAYFKGHPEVQTARLNIIDNKHSSTSSLSKTWDKEDEWYNFKDINTDINVLIEIDESSYQGGTNGDHHPISWYHNFDGGRAFYTAMGHTEESYQDSKFLKHLVGALRYTTNLSLAAHTRMPEESKFVREVLDFNLNEPMELDELPNTGIIFIERRGVIKLYDFATKKTEIITNLDVAYGNEDGLLGLAVDPNYSENNWIYLFYSVVGDEPIQHVSRFDLVDKKLDLASEKVLITIPTIRKCCHSGGGIEFDAKGNLFIGVGDNTNPFESDGFAPIDEREGRALWDSQKSAGNTNDLRGAILRIKPEDDGSYSIPEGNLFPIGMEKTKPEIYVMGVRNPFRFDIDNENGFLYWGDVGPDAGKTIADRGSKGLGEFNQARTSSNWGWPYTRGNNIPYNDYDFATEKSGEKFDPNNLINNSPNNTGINKLPPANESMVWYSYDASEEFPWLGVGGVNPMAGPVFHASEFDHSVTTFPSYFEDKLFVYEWIRDWFYVITLDENNNYVRADQFMPKSRFNNPMDMLFASDGNMYVLEYGEKWNQQNEDARLNRISYVSGNRKPIAKITSDISSGSAPLTISFSGADSIDHDEDMLSYEWRVNGELSQSNQVTNTITFPENGEYAVELTVIDEEGQRSSETLNILVGNDAPDIEIFITPESKSYTDNGVVLYDVIVTDKQDGNSVDGTISADDIKVTFEYVSAEELAKQSALGHQKNETPEGKQLIDGSDCAACHGLSEQVNGPSYQKIASKYSSSDLDYLVKRVIDGGSGVWGGKPNVCSSTT